MKDYTPARVIERTPSGHLRRAEVLMAQIDNHWREDGEWVGNAAIISAPALTLAQLHIQLAHAKVASGEWTW